MSPCVQQRKCKLLRKCAASENIECHSLRFFKHCELVSLAHIYLLQLTLILFIGKRGRIVSFAFYYLSMLIFRAAVSTVK